MATSTAQTAAAAPIAEPTFLLSGTASECLAQLADRFPRLLSAAVLTSLPAKLPATKPYDFWRERPLSEVLERLCADLKLPALVQVAQQWRKLLALPQAAVMTAAEWCEVLAGRAQLSSPARFAQHGHALESWASPWIADERSAFWGPSRCAWCAGDVGSIGFGSIGGGIRLFYIPHAGDCVAQCSGADGRCGSPTCDGCCVGCVRGNADCWGACGAGKPCEAFTDAQPVIEAETLSGGPCVEGEDEQGEKADDRQDAPAEQPIALAVPPASPQPVKPIKPALPAPKPIAPSLPKVLTDDAKRLARQLTPSPTAKPPAKRKPLDVAGALAALRK
jgi:hypothetical protein